MVSPPNVWIVAAACPKGRMTSRASPTVRPLDGSSQEVPPSKSMPQLRPRANIASSERTTSTPEAMRPTRHALMKL